MLKQLIIMVLFLGLFIFACDKTEPERGKPQSQVSLNQEKPQQPEKFESKKPQQEKPEPKEAVKDPGLGANKGTSEVVPPALLIDAIKKGEVAKAKGLISSKKVDLNGKDSDGYAPLNYAALYGHKDIVDDLLAHNAKVDEAGPFNLTALHYAAFLGNKDIAQSLIKKGANVNAIDNYKNTPLHYAYFTGHADLKDLLKANGADEKAKNEILGFPREEPKAPGQVLAELFSAILFADDVALVAALIERDSLDVNAPLSIQDQQKTINVTPVQIALSGRPMIFRFLKGKGADFSKVAQSDVFRSVRGADAKFFAEVLDTTGTKATAESDHTTLLRHALRYGKAEVFELLVDRGANIYEVNDGLTLLDELARTELYLIDETQDFFKKLKTLLKKNVLAEEYNLKELQANIVTYTMGEKSEQPGYSVEAHVATDLVKEVFDLIKNRIGIDFSHKVEWKDNAQVEKALKDLQAK